MRREYHELISFVTVFTFYAPGRVRSVAIPLARDDLCLLVSMLFAGISNVAAKHNRDLSPLALRFKGEAIRLINQKMENQELAAHPVNICSIMHVASGVRVRLYVSLSNFTYLTLSSDLSRGN